MTKPVQMNTTPLVGTSYLGFESAADEDEIQQRSRYMLARALNIGRLVGFVGAGISVPYGYVDWPTFVSQAVQETQTYFSLDQFRQNQHVRAALEIINRSAHTSSNHEQSSQRALLVLGLCQELFERYELSQYLKDKIPHLIQNKTDREKRSNPNASLDPLRQIVDYLGIRRFVTTNYDREIERALVRIYNCPTGPLRLDPNDKLLSRIATWPGETQRVLLEGLRGLEQKYPVASGIAAAIADLPPASKDTASLPKVARAFSFSPDHLDDLVQFAVGAPGYEIGVFHLHGIETEPERLIVTERDYQQMYLLNEPTRRMNRDALNALFAGNAVLFMGSSMEDDDLLRPLREFVSERARGSHERPLFAIMKRAKNDQRTFEFRRYLYERYGVKAIYYKKSANESDEHAFCRELTNIARMRRDWWENWRRKPSPRRPQFGQFGCRTIHHYIETKPSNEAVVATYIHEVQRRFEADDAKVLLVTGSAGSGKGTIGVELTDPKQFGLRFDKSFFATLHFTNDTLSTIDAAARFLSEGDLSSEKPTGKRSTRSRSAIAQFCDALESRTAGT